MAEVKKTKKYWFEVLASVVEDSDMENKEEVLAFIDHEVDLLNKKSENSKQTKTQKENVEVMEKIKIALGEIGKAVTISELQAANPAMAEYSNQKLSALLKKLVASEKVIKTSDKKKSYFSLATIEETEN